MLFSTSIRGTLTAYKWNAIGYGSQYPAPVWGVNDNDIRDIVFAPDGKSVIVSGNNNPIFLEWSTNGFGLSDYSVNLSQGDRNIAIHPSGSCIAMCVYNGYNHHPYLKVLKYNPNTFKFDTIVPNTSPTGWKQSLVFSADGNILFTVGPFNTFAGLVAYAWDNVTLTPGKLLHSTTAIGPQGDDINISLNSKTGDIATSSSQTVSVKSYNSGFGSYSNPKIWVGKSACAKFSPDGNSIAIKNSKTIEVYSWIEGTGFGSLLSTKTYSGDILQFEFSPTGDAICISSTTTQKVFMYEFDSSTGIGNEYPQMSPALTFAPTHIAFN